MCKTAHMPADPQPIHAIDAVDEFVARVSAEREADGDADHITDPGVYQILDGIMAGRETTTPVSPKAKADRRRRATERSRTRVPYDD